MDIQVLIHNGKGGASTSYSGGTGGGSPKWSTNLLTNGSNDGGSGGIGTAYGNTNASGRSWKSRRKRKLD